MIGGHDVEIIALIAQKGGVGKSTCAHNIGAGMAQAGRKVLMIDLDPQCSLSSIAGASLQGVSILEVIQRKASAGQAVQHCGKYDVIAGSEGLAADGIISGKGREYRLREALQGLSGYDYILLDNPPSLGIITVNALTAADSIIIPASADTLSLKALSQLWPTVQAVREHSNKALRIRGIVITRYNARAILSREAVEMIAQQAEAMGTKVYDTKIRQGVSLQEAQAMQVDIFEYAPRSNVAQDYQALTKEIIGGGKHGK